MPCAHLPCAHFNGAFQYLAGRAHSLTCGPMPSWPVPRIGCQGHPRMPQRSPGSTVWPRLVFCTFTCMQGWLSLRRHRCRPISTFANPDGKTDSDPSVGVAMGRPSFSHPMATCIQGPESVLVIPICEVPCRMRLEPSEKSQVDMFCQPTIRSLHAQRRLPIPMKPRCRHFRHTCPCHRKWGTFWLGHPQRNLMIPPMALGKTHDHLKQSTDFASPVAPCIIPCDAKCTLTGAVWRPI